MQVEHAQYQIKLALSLAFAFIFAIPLIALLTFQLDAAELTLRSIAHVILTLSFDEGKAGTLDFSSLYIFYDSLPRAVAAVAAGAALGVSGVILQTITRNALASPSLLGVGGGAYFALTVALIFFPNVLSWSPLTVALFGSLVAVVLIYFLSGISGRNPVRLVLAGTAVSMTFFALASALSLLHEQAVAGLFLWGAGSTTQLDWQNVHYVLPRLFPLLILSFFLAKNLDVWRLGDSVAESLGLPIFKTQCAALILSACLVALSVVLVGPLSFVGLVVASILRLMGITKHTLLFLLAMLLGPTLLLFADAITVYFATTRHWDIATGVVTAMIGAPFLLLLILRLPVFNRISTDSAMRCMSPKGIFLSFSRFCFMLVVVNLIFSYLLLAPHTFPADIVQQLRLPRLLVGFASGSLLALSGLFLQGLIRNPLAGPEIIGVTQGAGLFAILSMLVFPHALWLMPLASLVGGCTILFFILFFARKTQFEPMRLALIGIALSALLASANHFLISISGLRVTQVLTWLTGSLYGATWTNVEWLMPVTIILNIVSIFFSRILDYLRLPDDIIVSLGINIKRCRRLLASLAVLLASLAAASVGVLSFIGLMAPHITRKLFIADGHRQYALLTSLMGGLLVVIADYIGFVLFYPTEIPVGLLAAIIGGPFFLYLLATTE